MMDATSRADLFLQLSSALCGAAIDSFKPASGPAPIMFPKVGDLRPRNTPIDRTAEFLRTLDQNVGPENVDELLVTFSQMKATGSAASAAESLFKDKATSGICSSVMKMWFLGMWYSPSDPRTPHHVISTQAYKEALVWKIMQSHPMGYSVWSFGYWADEPPSLDNFVTVSE